MSCEQAEGGEAEGAGPFIGLDNTGPHGPRVERRPSGHIALSWWTPSFKRGAPGGQRRDCSLAPLYPAQPSAWVQLPGREDKGGLRSFGLRGDV